MVKLLALIVFAVWIRATLPRFRYDKLMNLGWKVLIPAGLLWILITGALIALPTRYSDVRTIMIVVAGTVLLVLLVGPLYTRRPTPPAPSRAPAGANREGGPS